MPIGQDDAANVYSLRPEPARKRLRSTPAAAVRISIEGQVDGPTAIAQLLELTRVQMIAQRAGDIAKTGLPQHGVVE